MKKRSVTIAGHRTSISIEEPFWDELNAWAAAEGLTLAALVRRIDEERGEENLSSAIRTRVFLHVKERAASAD